MAKAYCLCLLLLIAVAFATSSLEKSDSRSSGFVEVNDNSGLAQFGPFAVYKVVDLLQTLSGKKGSLQLYEILTSLIAEPDHSSGDCLKLYEKSYVYLPDLPPHSYYIVTGRESATIQPYVIVFAAEISETLEYAQLNIDKIYLTEDENGAGVQWYHLEEAYANSLIYHLEDEHLSQAICAADTACSDIQDAFLEYQVLKDSVFNGISDMLDVAALMYEGNVAHETVLFNARATQNVASLLQRQCLQTAHIHNNEFRAATSLMGKVLGNSIQLDMLFTSLGNQTESEAAYNGGATLDCSSFSDKNATYSSDTCSTWTTVTATCNSGYSLIGTSATTQDLLCNGKTGKWEPTPLQCAMMCPVMEVANCYSIEGGIDAYLQPQGSGTKLLVTCDFGYLINNTVSDNIEVTCDNGNWSPITPTCLLGCQTLSIDNADITGQVENVQLQPPTASISIICQPNYSINESGIMEMNVSCANGNWNPFVPNCELGCFNIHVDNSDGNYTANLQSGAETTISCSDNCTINGTPETSETVKCLNGQLVPPLPQCLQLCPALTIPQAILLGSDSVSETPQLANSEVIVSCLNEYTLNGTASNRTMLTCNNGWWNPGIPGCAKVCSGAVIDNSIVTGCVGNCEDNQPSTSQLFIQCNDTYTIGSGFDTIVNVSCNNGTWEPELPVCNKMCPPLPVTYANLSGGVLPLTSYQIPNTTVSITCWSSETFYLKCDAGNWNQTTPICNGFKHDLAIAIDQRLLTGTSKQTTDFIMSLLYQLPISESFNRIALVSFCDSVHIDKVFKGGNDHKSIAQQIANLPGGYCDNPDFDKLLEKLSTSVFNKPPGDARSCAKMRALIVTGMGNLLLNEQTAARNAQPLIDENVIIRFVTLYGSSEDNYQQSLTNIFGLGCYADFPTFNYIDLPTVSTKLMDLSAGSPPDTETGITGCSMLGTAVCNSIQQSSGHAAGCYTYTSSGAAVSTYHCNCTSGYKCQRCDHMEKPCDRMADYCQYAVPQYCVGCDDCSTVPPVVCACQDGYKTDWKAVAHGELQCSKDIDECADFICKNGATCQNTHGSYKCICPFGYGGSKCDIPANCEESDWVTCGTNAFCDVNDSPLVTRKFLMFNIPTGGMGTCRCKSGLSGNPYLYCGSDTLAQITASVSNLGTITTFDGQVLDGYRGSCPVTLLRKSTKVGFFNVADFKIVMTPSAECIQPQNAICQRSIAEVNVILYNHAIKLNGSAPHMYYFDDIAHTDSFMMDKIFVFLNNNEYQIIASELYINISVGFGNPIPSIQIAIGNSTAYHNRIAGLTGNFNFDSSDDMQTADGVITNDVGKIADSYIVETFGTFSSFACLPSFLTTSDHSLYDWAAETRCKHLSDRNGPFALCYEHMSLEEIYAAYLDCLQNVTEYYSLGSDFANKRTCEGPLTTFANRCRDVVQPINATAVLVWKWRHESDCILDCPNIIKNSMYCSLHPPCQNSCNNTCYSQMCPDTFRVEGCFCYYDMTTTPATRYVLSVDDNNVATCVPYNQCDPEHDFCQQNDDRFVTVSYRDSDDIDDGCIRTQKPI